jgi:hypothetical protein
LAATVTTTQTAARLDDDQETKLNPNGRFDDERPCALFVKSGNSPKVNFGGHGAPETVDSVSAIESYVNPMV